MSLQQIVTEAGQNFAATKQAETFVVDYDGIYEPDIKQHTICFSPLGWALIGLGNEFGDKCSYAQGIGMGLEAYKQLLPLSKQITKPALMNAFLCVHEIITQGQTQHFIHVDDVSSGLQLISTMLHDHKGMSIVGLKKMAIEKALYADFPDSYTTFHNALLDRLPPSQRNIKGVSRLMTKEAIIPYVYGSQRSIVDVYGEEIGLVLEEAIAHEIPSLPEYFGIMAAAKMDRVIAPRWRTPSGSLHGYDRHVPAPIHFERDGIEYAYNNNRKLVEGDEVEYDSQLPANLNHSNDADLIAFEVYNCHHHKISMMDTHDSTAVTPNHVNAIHAMQTDYRVELVQNKHFERMLTEASGRKFKLNTPQHVIDQTVDVLVNSHQFNR